MARTCPHCGEVSDSDRVCTWCNKSLAAEGQPAAGPGTQAAAKPAAASGPPAAAGPIAPKVGPSARAERPSVPEPRPLWPYYLGAAVTIVVVGLGALFMSAKAAAGPPPEPADWADMQSKTKLFTISVPANYKFSSSGSSGSYEQMTVKATKLCRVYVDGTGTKGAMSDVAAATSRMTGGDSSSSVSRRGEGKFHVAQGELYKKTRDRSFEESEDIKAWNFAGMPGAYSEYTTVKKVGLFPVKMKGWRLSCMGGDFGYQVWAEAPESQWEKFKPIATKILKSAKMNSQ